MKKFFPVFLFCLFFFTGFSQTGTLKIVVAGINVDKGNIKAALYNRAGEKSFLKDLEHVYVKKEVQITNESTVIIFQNIPYGTYALALFQDENNNGKIDRAVMGFPIEPYGISGNKNTLGPPSFNDAEFDMNTSYKILNIRLKTWLKANVE